jgi:aryl carrier-like protein
MENIYQTVIDSLHNEVMTLRKQVKKLENEAQIVQAGLDFLEVQELDEEIRNEIKSKKLDEEIREKFKRIREMRN